MLQPKTKSRKDENMKEKCGNEKGRKKEDRRKNGGKYSVKVIIKIVRSLDNLVLSSRKTSPRGKESGDYHKTRR